MEIKGMEKRLKAAEMELQKIKATAKTGEEMLTSLTQRVTRAEIGPKRDRRTGVPSLTCCVCNSAISKEAGNRLRGERLREIWIVRDLLRESLGKKDRRADRARKELEDRHGVKV